MAKISKVFYLVLVLSLVSLSACKKSSKGRSINGGDQGQPYPDDANYTIEILPDEAMDNFVNLPRVAFDAPEHFPVFNGPKRVEELKDTSVKIYFDALSRNNLAQGWQEQNPYYYIFVLNNNGKYQQKIYRDIETDYPFKENYILLEGLAPDTSYTVLILLGTYSYFGFNRRAITFRTRDYPDPPRTVLVSAGHGSFPSVFGSTANPGLSSPHYGSGVSQAKYFTDSACTQEVVFPLSVGEHRFYAKYYNSLGNSSSCSTAYAHYTRVECPEDYLVVPPEEALGTPAFCIMPTEARRGANDVAVPGYQEYPWETTPQEAKDACRRIGPKCDIITNLEWMATARHLSRMTDNWINHTRIFPQGIVDTGTTVLNISDPTDMSYNWYFRRYVYLPSGILWDFGGNLAEWADNAVVGGEVFQPITNTCPQGPFDIVDPEFSCPELDPRYYTPFNPFENPLEHDLWNYTGKIVGPDPADRNSATPIAAARGGKANYRSNSGIYSLFMFNHMTDTNGFRCVCHL